MITAVMFCVEKNERKKKTWNCQLLAKNWLVLFVTQEQPDFFAVISLALRKISPPDWFAAQEFEKHRQDIGQ